MVPLVSESLEGEAAAPVSGESQLPPPVQEGVVEGPKTETDSSGVEGAVGGKEPNLPEGLGELIVFLFFMIIMCTLGDLASLSNAV